MKRARRSRVEVVDQEAKKEDMASSRAEIVEFAMVGGCEKGDVREIRNTRRVLKSEFGQE